MIHKSISIRTFIGSKDYQISRSFYKDIGFEESVIDSKMSYFRINNLGFYLQDYYVKKWVNNSMIFLEVEDVDYYWEELNNLNLIVNYPNVKLTPIKKHDWGKECFMHDPSGNLWHFGQFTDLVSNNNT